DVYSLGVMLFEMLTGRLPLNAASTGELISMHLVSEPPKLVSMPVELPRPLAALVDSMLVKDPAARPSMAQIVEESSKMAGEILMASSPISEDRTETRLGGITGNMGPEVALKPTGPLSVDTKFLFDAPELRRLLNRLLPTDDVLEAFMNVHFPKLK